MELKLCADEARDISQDLLIHWVGDHYRERITWAV
jgi:hypothetical protein